MNVEDTTQLSSRRRVANDHGRSRKILLSDFSYPPLAVFAKRCCRMATCIVNMYPESSCFAWETFSTELKRLSDEGRGQKMLCALKDIAEDGDKKDELIRFVSFLPCSLVTIPPGPSHKLF